jgi:3-deoxy-D-manno-octulosonic-acid transferase
MVDATMTGELPGLTLRVRLWTVSPIMVWFLYNILFIVGFVLMMPRFLYRMARRGGYARDFGQRFVWYGSDVRAQLAEGGRIWIHAVSVGEIFIALKFMNDWRIRRPDLRFVLTTTTSTAHAIGRRNVKAPDVLLYFPLDIPWVMRRVLDAIRPRALIMVELELWPNLVRLAKRRGLPIMLVNGRISDHSFRGYNKLRAFTRRILPMIDLLCVQSETDRKRFLHLGAREQAVRIMGSAKYDVATADVSGAAKARAVLESAGLSDGGPYLLGGSTWRGEEAILLDALMALRGRCPSLVLLLAPRHAERTPSVLEEIEARNLHVVRRSHRWKASRCPPDRYNR